MAEHNSVYLAKSTLFTIDLARYNILFLFLHYNTATYENTYRKKKRDSNNLILLYITTIRIRGCLRNTKSRQNFSYKPGAAKQILFLLRGAMTRDDWSLVPVKEQTK
ncbi:MAG: hypothetical protein MJZ30_13045 [Paludibacteraceae bacterium]|nr:hypothetical protein [Paludibacteraceae bacterium]